MRKLWAEELDAKTQRWLWVTYICWILAMVVYLPVRYPLYFPISESKFALLWWPAHACFLILLFGTGSYFESKSRFRTPTWYSIGSMYCFSVFFVLTDPWLFFRPIQKLKPNLESVATMRFWFLVVLGVLALHACFLVALDLKLSGLRRKFDLEHLTPSQP